jgi:hypothetical protein
MICCLGRDTHAIPWPLWLPSMNASCSCSVKAGPAGIAQMLVSAGGSQPSGIV